ncbi:ATP-binding protein [Salinispirillum sp. LH 10-3-1]|uniref:histidine kinase n=1 Tax=Salinispirillum sp. LH 10-3-1 TaxID=2952525 RepID=A0AB38YJA7_9GAMM
MNSVEDNSIVSVRRSTRWSIGLLLLFCFCLLISVGYLYWQTHQRQQALISIVRENLLWATTQLDREAKQWALFLSESERLQHFNPDDLELRFEILFSRYVTLNRGELRDAIREDYALGSLLEGIGLVISDLDDEVALSLQRKESEPGALLATSDSLLEVVNHFLNRVVAVRSEKASRSRDELLSTLHWLTVVVSLLITGTVLLIVLLIYFLFKEQKQLSVVSSLAKKLKVTAEHAKSASVAKSNFLAMMSHEIRTPINGVIGILNVLDAEKLAGKHKHYIKTALDSAGQLNVIVNDILDMSNLETGRLIIDYQPMSLYGLVQELCSHVEGRLSNKPVSFTFNWEASVPSNVVCDRNRLRQIIYNLLDNAIKFTSTGSISLVVSWKEMNVNNSKGRLGVYVEDTGIGIDPAAHMHLFHKFNQLDSAENRRYGGSGLGLTICHELVKLMEGEIGVRSEPNSGSTFWFELPLDACAETTDTSAAQLAFIGFDSAGIKTVERVAASINCKAVNATQFAALSDSTVLLLCHWTAEYNRLLDLINGWRESGRALPPMVALVDPDELNSAYQFIKAGGSFILAADIADDILAQRLLTLIASEQVS